MEEIKAREAAIHGGAACASGRGGCAGPGALLPLRIDTQRLRVADAPPRRRVV